MDCTQAEELCAEAALQVAVRPCMRRKILITPDVPGVVMPIWMDGPLLLSMPLL